MVRVCTKAWRVRPRGVPSPGPRGPRRRGRGRQVWWTRPDRRAAGRRRSASASGTLCPSPRWRYGHGWRRPAAVCHVAGVGSGSVPAALLRLCEMSMGPFTGVAVRGIGFSWPPLPSRTGARRCRVYEAVLQGQCHDPGRQRDHQPSLELPVGVQSGEQLAPGRTTEQAGDWEAIAGYCQLVEQL
jgi:hypothetical protein